MMMETKEPEPSNRNNMEAKRPGPRPHEDEGKANKAPTTANQQQLSEEVVAAFLIQQKHWLTALEFFQELKETKGVELHSLKKHLEKEYKDVAQRNLELALFSTSGGSGGSGGSAATDQVPASSSGSSSHGGGALRQSSSSSALSSMSSSPASSPASSTTTSAALSVAQSLLSASSTNDSSAAALLRKKDDKIVLLEYELRLVKEDLAALKKKTSSTVAASATITKSHNQNGKQEAHLPTENLQQRGEDTDVASPEEMAHRERVAEDLADPKDSSLSSATKAEQLAINFMVKTYLVKQGYKLSAVTFSEELEEDVDSWLASGDVREPPSMLSLYRYFYQIGSNKELFSVKDQLQDLQKKYSAMNKRIEEADKEIKKLREENAQLSQDKANFELLWGENEKKVKRLEREQKQWKEQRQQHHYQQQQKQLTTQNNGRSSAEPEKKIPSPPSSTKSTTDIEHELKHDDTSPPGVPASGLTHSPSDSNTIATTEKNGGCSTHSLPNEQLQDDLWLRRKHRRSKFLNQVTTVGTIDDSRIQKQVERIATLERDNQSAVKIVAEALPHVIPGVLLNIRQELIPIILCVLRQHPNAKTRDQLTQMLFNLIKIPDEQQRNVIMHGCIALARIVGHQRVGTELLPQIWEQINNKHKERRVLVAEACGSLAPYVAPELRPSLILSILTQLLDDTTPFIRSVTARNLATLITHFAEAEADKYTQVQELVIRLILDPEDEVVEVTQEVLLPIFMDWADSLDLLCSRFLAKLLNEIESVTTSRDESTKTVRHLGMLLDSFAIAIPRFHESVLASSPFDDDVTEKPIKGEPTLAETRDSILLLRPKQKEQLQKKFDALLEGTHWKRLTETEEAKNWSPFVWLVSACFPRLVEILLKGNMRLTETWSLLCHGLTDTIHNFCKYFGVPFIRAYVEKFFVSVLLASPELPENATVQKEGLLQVYLVGILPCLQDTNKLLVFLKELIVNIAMEEEGWNSSHARAVLYCLELLGNSPVYDNEATLTLFWELVVHPAGKVREIVVHLFDKASNFMTPEQVSKRVLPALITLSNDTEAPVRLASIQPIGNVAMHASNPLVLERVNAQFDFFVEDSSWDIKLALVNTFGGIIPHVKSQFRDAYLLPKLRAISSKLASSCTDTTLRNKVAQSLFEAYRAFNGSLISQEVLRDGIIPSLNQLIKETQFMPSSYHNMIRSMVNDMEAALKADESRAKGQKDKESIVVGGAGSAQPHPNQEDSTAITTGTSGSAFFSRATNKMMLGQKWDLLRSLSHT